MGDHFSFARVLGAVARVEEASLDGNERVVVIAVTTFLCERILIRIGGKDIFW